MRFVQKLGAGVDRVDLKICEERGIAVARLAGGNAIPVAEHTLLLILATLRRLPVLDRRTRAGEWLKENGRTLVLLALALGFIYYKWDIYGFMALLGAAGVEADALCSGVTNKDRDED